MNLVVSINSGYVPPLCVMLRSLLNAQPECPVSLYIIHSQLTDEDFKVVRTRVPDQRLTIFPVPVPADFLQDAPVLFHFPKEMYYRIFSAQLLPRELDRALYLDPDMVINRSLMPLYNMEMEGAFFAAARAINPLTQLEYKRRLNMPEDSEYFNSGVLLMNLEALRKDQDPQQVLTFITDNREKLILPDQDILNALYYNKTLLLDPLIYNFDARYYGTLKLKTLGRIDLDWIRKNTAIIHYCGKNKPWQESYRSDMGIFYDETEDSMIAKTKQ